MKDFIKAHFPQSLTAFLKRRLSEWRIYKARRAGVSDFLACPGNQKTRVLFFHPYGLNFGGTEKSIQIIARHLDRSKFDIYFMYSAKKNVSRKPYLENCGVNFIEFDYSTVGDDIPFVMQGMQPHIFDVLKNNNIDIVITSGAGYPEFPIANLKNMPVIFLNMFGSVDTQSNIAIHYGISELLVKIISSALPKARVELLPIQSEGSDAGAPERGRELRRRFGIPEDHVVFGRIGRPDDGIFDPIGIEAFRAVAAKYNNANYIIVAPPPALQKILAERPIERVHLLPPTGEEKEIWAFHNAIDVLAHFRHDGETMGLNIAESMLCGKPIITHVSHFWNAHLEFLDESYALVTPSDDVAQYARNMEFFLSPGNKEKTVKMGEAARARAEKMFLIGNNIDRIQQDIAWSVKPKKQL